MYKTLQAKTILLSVLALFSFNSCKSRNAEAEVKGTNDKAVSGIPKFFFGVHDLNTDEVSFESGKKMSNNTLVRGFTRMPGTGGQVSSTPWQCQDAEAFFGAPRVSDPAMMCRVELIGSGRLSADQNGTAASVIGLPGMTSWSPKVPALSPSGSTRLISAGPPNAPNLAMDENAVFDAMKQARGAMKFQESFFRDCLGNPKTAEWSDIQAHYYCVFPYTIRYCYSTILTETRNPVKALAYCSDSANASDWNSKRDSMFALYAPGSADWTWLMKNQKDVFVYVMFSQLGVTDFNIESQNRVINNFYKNVMGFDRPRRAVDPFPKWLAEQPRYDSLRLKQSSGASTSPATAPIQVPPTPIRPPTTQPVATAPKPTEQKAKNIKVGLYAEINSLEAATCSLRVKSITTVAAGDMAALEAGGAQCFIAGQQRRTDLPTSIVCKSGSCSYIVEQPNGTLFQRSAVVMTNDTIVIKGTNDNFTWKRIAN